VVEGVKVLHGELLLESYSGTLEKLRTRGDENDVTDVEQQVSNVGVTAVDEQRGTTVDQVGSKAVVPSSRCLLQAVEGLVESAHQLRVSRVNEVGRLEVVDRLGEGVVEEGGLTSS
jgi:hypothetical protein